MLRSRLENTARLCRDYSHMIGSAARGQGRKELVADAELLGIRPVVRDVGLGILDTSPVREFIHFPVVDGSQGHVASMAEVSTQRIGRVCLVDAVGPGE